MRNMLWQSLLDNEKGSQHKRNPTSKKKKKKCVKSDEDLNLYSGAPAFVILSHLAVLVKNADRCFEDFGGGLLRKRHLWLWDLNFFVFHVL